jgi:pimeloyl-ACP methyl ester carboxylesterase
MPRGVRWVVMAIAFERRGSGKPLLLVHGLGSSRAAWDPVVAALAKERELILLDLPGHGASPAEQDSGTFDGLARSLGEWVAAEKLTGVPMVGSSLGARLVLEMARRGVAGPVVALDPGGFWQGWERTLVRSTLLASAALMRALRGAIPALSRNSVSRSLLLAQLSARPWALDGAFVAHELTSLADTPTAASLVRDLASGPVQQGPSASGPVTIGWGRHDRLCLPVQAERAQRAFPGSRLVWFEHSSHFPMWDEPAKAAALILEAT